MLSILIPIYNFDVRELVAELHRQCVLCNVPFEIICFDDASVTHIKNANKDISNHAFVNYIELNENIGRSAIRNKLAETAKYDFLLFMDCDSRVTHQQYIRNYLTILNLSKVIYGGRIYDPNPPLDDSRFFRWYYGSKREVIAVKRRSRKPYESFQTNNFVIPRKIYLSIKLNEKLRGYGHEDTLFGNNLMRKEIEIIHIDNPLCHIDLDKNTDFLRKTDEGIRNMSYIINHKLDEGNIRLASFYRKIKKIHLHGFVYFLFKKFNTVFYNNLISKKPKLFCFDFYKIGRLIEVLHYSKSE